jgi:hypothetical protein
MVGHVQNYLYFIEFVKKRSKTIVIKQNFKNVNAYSGRNNHCIYKLCKECDAYIDKDQSNKSFEVGWCSFILAFLSNTDIHKQYGDHVWTFIPKEWRSWWMLSLQMKFPSVFNCISLSSPSPIFKGKSNDIKNWDDDIKSYLLSRLAHAANTYLMPTVKCPWECSEFQHKVGYKTLDILFQQHLQKCCNELFSDKDGMEKALSAHEDCICECGDGDFF